MKEENKKEFLDVPTFVSLGKRYCGGSGTKSIKRNPVLTARGRVIVVLLVVLMISGLIFWM